MGQYKIILTRTAEKDLEIWKKSGQKNALKKIEKIFEDLKTTPFKGIGKPEPLKHELSDYWSRRITEKDRIIYQVDGLQVIVIILSAKGHYYNK